MSRGVFAMRFQHLGTDYIQDHLSNTIINHNQPWQQQKQQSKLPKIASMNGSSSPSQVQYQHQPNTPFSEATKLQTPPSYINGACLSAMEFRDALHLQYCRTPPNLPTHRTPPNLPTHCGGHLKDQNAAVDHFWELAHLSIFSLDMLPRTSRVCEHPVACAFCPRAAPHQLAQEK